MTRYCNREQPARASGRPYRIQIVRWAEAQPVLEAIRRKVFIDEQAVPEALEWEAIDVDCPHLLALVSEQHAVGCARVLPGGSIGRMAVLPAWRGQGIGSALLQAAISYCRDHALRQLSLSAQVHAIPFYARFGFVVSSEVYDDAGIPHQTMLLDISD